MNVNRAIILAAGMGTRLGEHTKETPKCLIKVNGEELLGRSLDLLERNGIQETILVVGHLADRIISFAGEKWGDMKITYIMSETYDQTNNMYSLWLARNYLEQGSLLIEGDVIFEENVLREVIRDDREHSLWVVDNFTSGMDGSMSIVNEDGRIQQTKIVREELPEYKENFHKSVGILKINSSYGKLFSSWLDQEVQQGNVNVYYDLVLAKNLHSEPLHICSINGMKWFEIDDQNDLNKAEKMFGGEK